MITSENFGDAPPGGSVLITRSDHAHTYTDIRETDARTALTRGLKEYLEQLYFTAPGGREITFRHVLSTWAEFETIAVYPAAAVQSVGAATYEASRLTPSVSSRFKLEGEGSRYLFSPAELVVDLTVDCWMTDPEERVAISTMLEDAFSPVDFMYGFRLDLPHYFNARGVYELLSMIYEDPEADVTKRYRRAVFTLRGKVPVLRVVSYPQMLPRARVKEVGPDVDIS